MPAVALLSEPKDFPMRASSRLYSFCVFAIASLAFLRPDAAVAQSLGIGFGLGVPLMDYITEETAKEYRITPEPGYYPTLQTLQNASGSLHFNASLLLDLELPVDVEIRFDAARMRWQQSVTTHVTCTPIDVVNGTFNDATADYVKLSDVGSSCLDKNTYKSKKDISKEERSSLWFFHISGGIRYNFWESENWKIFIAPHLGLTIATIFNESTQLGGNIDAILGVMFRLSELIWIEFDAKILFMLTQPPTDAQTRINHETQIGGNIFTSLVQSNAYVDFQLSIRFDFNAL